MLPLATRFQLSFFDRLLWTTHFSPVVRLALPIATNQIQTFILLFQYNACIELVPIK